MGDVEGAGIVQHPPPLSRGRYTTKHARIPRYASQNLVCRMVIIDSPESSWVQGMQDDGTISKFVPIDFNDEATVFEKCLAAVRDVERVLPPPLNSLACAFAVHLCL